ncbi:MAG TPA: hypothetical protein VFP19_04265, partial [Candidatus Limnocylindrales bacterium]|nr:hypothetical protein [Candidatus Limnocylindrales bacterium]
MAAEQIAQSLAYINWTLLVSLAVGSFWAVAVGRLTTAATKGYLAFVAFTAAGLAALAALSDGALPLLGATLDPSGGPILPGDAAHAGARTAALWGLALAAAIYGVVLLRGSRARWLGIGGSVVGAAVLVAGALSWGTP